MRYDEGECEGDVARSAWLFWVRKVAIISQHPFDYTVKGAVDEYMSAIDELWCEGIQLFTFYERNEYN